MFNTQATGIEKVEILTLISKNSKSTLKNHWSNTTLVYTYLNCNFHAGSTYDNEDRPVTRIDGEGCKTPKNESWTQKVECLKIQPC